MWHIKEIKSFLKRIRNIMYLLILGRNKIKKAGKNNQVNVNSSSYLKNTHISISGNNNTVDIGEECNITGLRMLIVGENNLVCFKKGVIINASTNQPTVINAVGGKTIHIGEGALLSNNIEIHTTDYHGIYNAQGKRINTDKDIIIGNHVWIGLGVKILKGTEIAAGCMVGAGSLLSGIYPKENCIIAGNPAKIIKEQIFWKHQMADCCEVPECLKERCKN